MPALVSRTPRPRAHAAGSDAARLTAAERIVADPVLSFMRLIWAIDHALQSLSKRMESALGLTVPQRMALLLIGRRPGILASELARLLHLNPGTISGVLSRLDAGGFIRKRGDTADARRVRLELTSGGRAANKRRAGTFEAAVHRLLTSCPVDDIDGARRVLARLATELQPSPIRSATRVVAKRL